MGVQRRFVELVSGSAAGRCQVLAAREGLVAVVAPQVDGRLIWPAAGSPVTVRAGGGETPAQVVERRLKPFPVLVLRTAEEIPWSEASDALPGSRLIAVASGKGGTGKTMVSANLATALAQHRRVALLDADFGTANAALAFGLGHVPHIGDLLDGEASLDDVMVPVRQSLFLIPGGSGSAELANLNEWQFGRLVTVMEELDRRVDIIVVDVGAGIGRQVTNLLAIADETLLVTNPEPAALLDAYALLKVLVEGERRPDLHVVINRARSDAEARDAYQRVRQAAGHFLNLDPELVAIVPDDDAVVRCARARRPLIEAAPSSRAARALRGLAARLSGAPAEAGGEVAAGPAAAGWLDRLRALFAS